MMPWENDKLQFARLICELDALGVFTDRTINMLCAEMDLEPADVRELLDRAQSVYLRFDD